jgi:hypothetical protein
MTGSMKRILKKFRREKYEIDNNFDFKYYFYDNMRLLSRMSWIDIP